MRHLAVFSLVFCIALVLPGCMFFTDRTEAYREAVQRPPLKVVQDHDRSRIAPRYPLPTHMTTTALPKGSFEVPRPPDLTRDILEENYQVEEAGGQTWLLVNEVPGRVWPMVAQFLASRGAEPSYENPRLGLMQTGDLADSLRTRRWLDIGTDTADAFYLQGRVSPGVRRRTSEVQLRLLSGPAAPDSLRPGQAQSNHPEVEKRLLQEAAEFMQEQEASKSYSRAALELSGAPRVALVSEGVDQPYIRMELGLDRAWAEVSRALEEEGVPVVDIDRGSGLWYVDYRTREERESGWLFWNEVSEPAYTYLVSLRRHGEHLRLTTQTAPDYKGNNRSDRLLSDIFQRVF